MSKKKVFENFNHFNSYLIENFLDIQYIEYIELIQPSLFKKFNIKLIRYLFSLNEKYDEFCIDENTFIEYKLINNKNDISKLINYNELDNDTDFRVRKSIIKDQNKIIFEYKFTQYAFKKCLLRSNILYCDLYLIFEKCRFHFDIYQNNLKKNLNSVINAKLDNIYSELKNNKIISITD